MSKSKVLFVYDINEIPKDYKGSVYIKTCKKSKTTPIYKDFSKIDICKELYEDMCKEIKSSALCKKYNLTPSQLHQFKVNYKPI